MKRSDDFLLQVWEGHTREWGGPAETKREIFLGPVFAENFHLIGRYCDTLFRMAFASDNNFDIEATLDELTVICKCSRGRVMRDLVYLESVRYPDGRRILCSLPKNGRRRRWRLCPDDPWRQTGD